ELLAEAIQTVMRVYNEENPYEKLKALTRGEKITQDALNSFIDGLEQVPGDVKDRMKQLTPHNYVGLAPELVEEYFGK
ncbi:MAG: adenylosuccinate lyase, partial [Candidatus Omnitrophota bacterium]